MNEHSKHRVPRPPKPGRAHTARLGSVAPSLTKAGGTQCLPPGFQGSRKSCPRESQVSTSFRCTDSALSPRSLIEEWATSRWDRQLSAAPRPASGTG
jgi:hypothetical protein